MFKINFELGLVSIDDLTMELTGRSTGSKTNVSLRVEVEFSCFGLEVSRNIPARFFVG